MYSQPVGARIWPTSVRTRPSRASQVVWSPVRRVPRSTPCCGIAFAASPACTAPQTRTVPDRGSTWRVSRQRELGDQQSEGLDQVRRQVRAGGVATRRGELDLDQVAGRGDRAGPGAELAHLQPRVAVQGEDPLDAVDGAVRDHVHRSAGLHLLGGLEDQPDTAGQRGRARERETGAQHHRGVGVVPARVHDVRHRRGERQPGGLVQREGVDVGAQRHAAPPMAHVTDQAGAVGEGARLEACGGQQPADHRRGAALGPAQLRRGVQLPTPGDDLGPVQRQPGVQPRRTAARAHVDNRGAGGRHSGRVLLQDRHRTPPPLDSPWCISPYSSPGRRCTKQI